MGAAATAADGRLSIPVAVLLARFLPKANEVTEAIDPIEPRLLGLRFKSGGLMSSSCGSELSGAGITISMSRSVFGIRPGANDPASEPATLPTLDRGGT